MLTYKEYYEKCRLGWSEPKVNLYEFSVDEIDPQNNKSMLVSLSKKYLNSIQVVAAELNRRFEKPEDCWFPRPIEKDVAIRIKNVWNIPEVENVCAEIIPQIEKNLFGCSALVCGAYAYRSLKNVKPMSSWIWHVDDHPKEITKVMFYLTDVSLEAGPFEYIKYKENNNAVSIPPNRIDHTRWGRKHPRISEQEIEKITQEQNAERHKVIGSLGKITIFDNNIIHRANIPTKHHRDVIVLMLKPWHEPVRPYLGEQHTGTNYHKDIYMDPEHIGAEKRI